MLPHFTRTDQIHMDFLEQIYDLSKAISPISVGQAKSDVLDGRLLFSLFFEPSTRTRLSFGAAFRRLGGRVCETTGFSDISVAKGESEEDMARVVSGMADILVIRHAKPGAVSAMAEVSRVPIISGGEGTDEHPSQALLDAFTIMDERRSRGLGLTHMTIAIVGDLVGERAVQSLVTVLSNFPKMVLRFVSPTALDDTSPLIACALTAGHDVECFRSLSDGIRGADVVYASYLSKSGAVEYESVEGAKLDFCIDQRILNELCPPSVFVMHPLPRESRYGMNGVCQDLDDDPRLAVFRQSDNGVTVRMSLFAHMLNVQNDLRASILTQ